MCANKVSLQCIEMNINFLQAHSIQQSRFKDWIYTSFLCDSEETEAEKATLEREPLISFLAACPALRFFPSGYWEMNVWEAAINEATDYFVLMWSSHVHSIHSSSCRYAVEWGEVFQKQAKLIQERLNITWSHSICLWQTDVLQTSAQHQWSYADVKQGDEWVRFK